jgi:hypothetical protein
MKVKVIDLKNLNATYIGKYAIIEGNDKYIVCESDCCHSIFSKKEIADKFFIWKKEGENLFQDNIQFTFNDIGGLLESAEEKEFEDYIEYFGVKSRVRGNFNLLKDSVKEIGLQIEFPQWG